MDPHENSRPTPAPPTTLFSTTTSNVGLHRSSTWWPVRAGHALPPIVGVSLAWGELLHAAAGAPAQDNDLIRDEDYVPDPNSQPQSAGSH
ncbi:uncharacterized protein EDB91DRAFT_1250323 [Suillus paluster]|uniref:uncharacterized protein n=1 Tax=Suillus paluster TaxID=48578 RepID=UPI001B876169|nr:uncharacterized protein EDB91DRAFT_1250323 [Suillus paluster]KAG1735697.1 hypothetical protein EDB91DRAFT_1250323 [Suillus paluster]